MHRSIFNIAVNTRPSHWCWMPFLGPAAPWNTTYSSPQIIKHHLPACPAQGLLKQMLRGEIFAFLTHLFHLLFDFFNVKYLGEERSFPSILRNFFYCWHLLAVDVSCLWEQKPDKVSHADLCALLMEKALGKPMWRSAGATALIC